MRRQCGGGRQVVEQRPCFVSALQHQIVTQMRRHHFRPALTFKWDMLLLDLEYGERPAT